MAHVEQNSGLLKELDGGRIQDLGASPAFRNSVIGFQKVRSDSIKANLQIWLDKKVPCFVEGSDPKSIDEIGKGEPCFIKIGDFNFEAIRFSLIDYENRFSIPPIQEIHNSHIKSISFQGGLLNGKTVSFSPELNNLIGIRGSGKSSILEILRYTLNIPSGSQPVDKDYKDDLIRHVLKSGGKAIVEAVNRFGEIYKIERIYGQKEDIYKGDELQQGISLAAILRQPIYFGQKDLSNKNADFENDLVNKLVGGKLNDVQIKIDEQKQEVKKIVNEIQNLNNLSQLRKETETAKANAEHKLQVFKEKGVADKLHLQTVFESDGERLRRQKANITSYINDLQMLIDNHGHWMARLPVSTVNAEIFDAAGNLIRRLMADFDTLKTIIINAKKTDDDFQAVIDRFLAKEFELKEEFAAIKRDIDIPELNPDDFININRELETSKLKLLEIEKTETKRIELERKLNGSVNRLDDLWHKRFILLKTEVDKINQHGGKLYIDVKYKGRDDKFIDKLQDIFKGSHITKNMYSGIKDAYMDFIDMRKDEFRKLADIVTENQLLDVKDRFNANLSDLLTFQVENRIIIKFDGKALKEHSLGQRASALILFLLSQKENDVLIIDQPEDDLDNQTIYNDVIREIKRLKGQMQFIFATHNANIPVLGDSEMVIACGYIPDTEIITEAGSIDCRNIQQKIIDIMEGGKEAFEIRKNIYKIWEIGKP
jgi:ABC-type lipoprotein export system ATPase subunit